MSTRTNEFRKKESYLIVQKYSQRLYKSNFSFQFQDQILDISMDLLRLAFDKEISKDMGDAVTVARKLSRIVRLHFSFSSIFLF